MRFEIWEKKTYLLAYTFREFFLMGDEHGVCGKACNLFATGVSVPSTHSMGWGPWRMTCGMELSFEGREGLLGVK